MPSLVRPCFLLVALLLSWSACAQSVRPGHYGKLSPEAQVRWSELETWRASERCDSATLRLLLHDDYFLIGSDGAKLKARAIKRWTAGPPVPVGQGFDQPGHLRVHLFGSRTAVVTVDDFVRNEGGDTSRVVHSTDVWTKADGRWQLCAVYPVEEPLGADARSIRAGIVARNQAYATQDTILLGALLTSDFQMTSGAGSRTGRLENQVGMARLSQKRPDLVFVCQPRKVEIGKDLAAEAGSWTERWNEADGPTELGGTYLVMWVRQAVGWRQQAMLLVPTSCTGGAYCR